MGENSSEVEKGNQAYRSGDYDTALAEFHSAAEKGDVIAQDNLGFMYSEGKGVKQDVAKAARWYRRAAEQGFADSQYELGEMYYKGEGVPINPVRAYMWTYLAAEQEQSNEVAKEVAKKARDKLESELSPEQIQAGLMLAGHYLKNYYRKR